MQMSAGRSEWHVGIEFSKFSLDDGIHGRLTRQAFVWLSSLQILFSFSSSLDLATGVFPRKLAVISGQSD